MRMTTTTSPAAAASIPSAGRRLEASGPDTRSTHPLAELKKLSRSPHPGVPANTRSQPIRRATRRNEAARCSHSVGAPTRAWSQNPSDAKRASPAAAVLAHRADGLEDPRFVAHPCVVRDEEEHHHTGDRHQGQDGQPRTAVGRHRLEERRQPRRQRRALPPLTETLRADQVEAHRSERAHVEQCQTEREHPQRGCAPTCPPLVAVLLHGHLACPVRRVGETEREQKQPRDLHEELTDDEERSPVGARHRAPRIGLAANARRRGRRIGRVAGLRRSRSRSRPRRRPGRVSARPPEPRASRTAACS